LRARDENTILTIEFSLEPFLANYMSKHKTTNRMQSSQTKRINKPVTTPAPGQKDDDWLHTALIETPLGTMSAAATDSALILLLFTDKGYLEIENNTNCSVVQGKNTIISSIEKELSTYFSGELKEFKTPIQLIGTPFQQRVWRALSNIPYGETKSYAAEACDIGQPSAYRAVANANGANNLCVVIPCQRVIASSGKLGGYSSGIDKKRWLLNHEKRHKNI
jgi:AraC family transcriptional regulator of adaptative response/methylated-DNA-[protein]-cysteine methyltransferase